MSAAPLSILLIDDDAGDRILLRRAIRDSGVECTLEESDAFSAALASHAKSHFDFILIDNGLPDGNGIDLIDELHRTWPAAAVGLVTGLGSEDLAAGAIKKGAVDYIPKRNIDGSLMAKVIDNGVKLARLQQKIASQNAALRNFARVLAHDLRSPLQAVRFLAEAMLEDVAEADMEEIRANAAMMMTYSDRLTNLITSLEQYNTLDRLPEMEPANADKLLDSAIENLSSEIKDHAVRIEREPLPTIECNPPEIIRLFQNLISNSIKYRSSRPPVIRVSVGFARTPGMCSISVTDNGIGVPASERETVFEEFRRLHSHSKIAGTGLGLSMCRKIVERHGGTIWCEPATGGGTVFRFELPASIESCNHEDGPDAGRSSQSVA